MKLYYSPGACSLSPHVALRESELPFELVKVDFQNGRKLPDGHSLSEVYPRNYVPALQLDDGQMLGENGVMIQWIADQVPHKNLAPKLGSFERYRLMEKINFVATELHKGLSPFFAPKVNEEYLNATKERLKARFGVLQSWLDANEWLMGDTFTVVDGYALWTLRAWTNMTKPDLDKDFPGLAAYKKRLEARPAIKAALDAEGLR